MIIHIVALLLNLSLFSFLMVFLSLSLSSFPLSPLSPTPLPSLFPLTACSMQRVSGALAKSGEEGKEHRPTTKISLPKDKASVEVGVWGDPCGRGGGGGEWRSVPFDLPSHHS